MSNAEDSSGHDGAKKPATPAAGVAIFDRVGEILLGRHAHDGCWATFGGTIEPGEDARSAALREVREEIGVALQRLDPLGTFGQTPIYTVRYADGTAEEYEVTMFCAIVDPRCVPMADLAEIIATRWFSRDMVKSTGLACDMADIIPAAFDWFEHCASEQGDS